MIIYYLTPDNNEVLALDARQDPEDPKFFHRDQKPLHLYVNNVSTFLTRKEALEEGIEVAHRRLNQIRMEAMQAEEQIYRFGCYLLDEKS